jgi:hypothetical protein
LAAVNPYHGGGLHLHNGLFVGQLTEVVSEGTNGSVDCGPLDDDPTLCSDDFFHVTACSENAPGSHVKNMDESRIGMYMAENAANDTGDFKDPSTDITAFLTNIARYCSVTAPNIKSWVSAVKSKLANIGIFTIAEVIGAILTLNHTLFQAGHVPLY